MQPACCRKMEDPTGAGSADFTSRHTLASAEIQSRRASSAAGRVERVQFCLEGLALRLSCEGSSDRDRDIDRDRPTDRQTDRPTERRE